MQLSKEQKLEAYTYAMLIELSNENNRQTYICVCESLLAWSNDGDYDNTWEDCPYTRDSFPEFMAQKKPDISEYAMWWPMKSLKRLKAIERAIQLTEQL